MKLLIHNASSSGTRGNRNISDLGASSEVMPWSSSVLWFGVGHAQFRKPSIVQSSDRVTTILTHRPSICHVKNRVSSASVLAMHAVRSHGGLPARHERSHNAKLELAKFFKAITIKTKVKSCCVHYLFSLDLGTARTVIAHCPQDQVSDTLYTSLHTYCLDPHCVSGPEYQFPTPKLSVSQPETSCSGPNEYYHERCPY